MDSLVHSALDEICSEGSNGLPLQNLWPKLQSSLTTNGLVLCPYVKAALWSNLLRIPALQFEAQGISQQHSSIINSVEECEQINLKIIASESLRNNFVGIYDIEASTSIITKPQRRTLERLAIAGTSGITQSDLAKEFGIKGNNIFYILKKLETRGLIVRQSTVVKTRDVCGDGESKHSSIVSTNMLHLPRYAKHLGSQKRLEIIKEDNPFVDPDIADGMNGNGNGFAEESVKEDIKVKDFIPAMKAICDKLEQADGKVLTVSDIKRDLGYRKPHGHKAWRNILNRLKDAEVVEEFFAKVKNRDVNCLRLLKKFSPKHFEPKSSRLGDDSLDAEPLKRGQITEQLVELPIEHQVYDMIDAAGSKGLTVLDALRRLGLRNKQYYDRLVNMFYRLGMHIEAEIWKRGVAYRVWTSRNFNPEALDTVLNKPKLDFDQNSPSDPCPMDLEVDRNSALSILVIDASASTDADKSADAAEVEPGGSDVPVEYEEGNNVLLSVKGSHYSAPEHRGRVSDMELETVSNTISTAASLQHSAPEHCDKVSGKELETVSNTISIVTSVQHSAPEHSGRVSDIELETVSNTISTTASLEVSPPAMSKVSRRKSYLKYPCLTAAAVSSRREQWILKMLEEEKFLIKPELHRRLENLENLEKEKSTIMDRKTLERSLNKLQQEGRCKCINVSVPVITNLGRSRTTDVILHPSISTVTPEVLSQIHERMRSFELQVRRVASSRLKKRSSVPVLDGIQRIPTSSKLDSQAEQAEAMRANGYVLAKMVRTKLLHIFLWGYVSGLPDWNDVTSVGKQGYDMKNPHSTCRSFELDAAIKTMPLELFLQIAGSTQKFEDLAERSRNSVCLSDLPLQEFKCLMDTRAIGHLSWLVDILRRLKLIRFVSAGHADDLIKLQNTTLTHALEIKPYIEEPVSVVASSSGFFFPDLRPHIRHDFVLSTRKAVDEYWSTLEYCYAAANSKAALHAFPGSAVPKVFLSRSWVTTRVMSSDQRAQLLKRVVKDDPHKKISFKECQGIANDLNLTLEQVLRVYQDKRRLTRISKDSYAGDEEIQRQRSRKRKGSSERLSSRHAKIGRKDGQLSEEKLAGMSDAFGQSTEKEFSFLTSLEDDDCEQDHIDHLMEVADGQESKEEVQGDSFLHKCALSRLKTRQKKFLWNDSAERQLVIEYLRYRAALGAKFHRVDWGSLQNLPAPPDVCRRRMSLLNTSQKFRKATMRLCNMLAERYAKQLENSQRNFSNQVGNKVMVREHAMEEDYDMMSPDTLDLTNELEPEEQWDNFDDNSIKIALDDVLRCKSEAKLYANKRVDSDGWANGCDAHHFEVDRPASPSRYSQICGGRSKLTARRARRFPQNYNRLLNEGTGLTRKIYESVAVSNAVELFKLIFLSTSKAPQVSTILAETLRHYSQHDLFAAFSFLREKKIMIGGSSTSPFALSHQFLESISLSPFPSNAGKRASKFASWLNERGKDLMEEKIYLPVDLQCGDIFHLCALVSRGELSLTPYLPEEGVGEAEDSRISKRKSNTGDDCGGEISKRMRTSLPNDNDIITRREKGFPGIRLSLSCVTLPRTQALELFKNKDRDNPEDNTIDLHVTRISSGFDDFNPSKDIIDSGDVSKPAIMHNKSPWEAMASYAEYLFSSSSDRKRNSPFDPELFKTVCSEIRKSGDQGLSVKEISQVSNFPGEKEMEIFIEVLENFGRALKVHAYDSVHVVDPLYQTKYFMTSTLEKEQNPKIAQSVDSEGKIGDKHLLADAENNEIDIDGSPDETTLDNDEMHRITILNHPKELTGPSTEIRSRSEVEDNSNSESISVRRISRGEMSEMRTSIPHMRRRIIPWLNGDGTVNQLVYKGLIRRLVGILMQHPGMVEDEIIKQMHALNPQSCKNLLETMILENHIIARKMQESTSTQPPAILGNLLGSSYKNSQLIYREHFFANPMSIFLL